MGAVEFYVGALDVTLFESYDLAVARVLGDLPRPEGATDEMLESCACELGVRVLGSRALHEAVVSLTREAEAGADVATALGVLADHGVVALSPRARLVVG